MAGLENPNAGEILIGEQPVSRLRPAQRNVAMVFQSYALYPHLSVRDNLGFDRGAAASARLCSRSKTSCIAPPGHFPQPLAWCSPREARVEVRVNEVAAALELDQLLDRRPKELSEAKKQRVALGRAMARQPDVFLMDEPLSNLDAVASQYPHAHR